MRGKPARKCRHGVSEQPTKLHAGDETRIRYYRTATVTPQSVAGKYCFPCSKRNAGPSPPRLAMYVRDTASALLQSDGLRQRSICVRRVLSCVTPLFHGAHTRPSFAFLQTSLRIYLIVLEMHGARDVLGCEYGGCVIAGGRLVRCGRVSAAGHTGAKGKFRKNIPSDQSPHEIRVIISGWCYLSSRRTCRPFPCVVHTECVVVWKTRQA